MKIAVISTPVFPTVPPIGAVGYSGLEVIAWQCAKGLAERGHRVVLVAPDGSSCPNVQMLHTGPAGSWDEKTCYGGDPKRNYTGYWPLLLQVDAIIDHTWQKWAYMLKAEGRLTAPVLGICHAPVDTMFKELPPVDKPCMVCISDDQRSHFEALWNRPARTCHNGVDLDYYKPLGLKRSERFLFLARFSTIKGPHIALKACLEAGVGLDLIGDTSITNEPDYFKLCQQLSERESLGWDQRKGKQLRLIGPVTRGESVWWFSQAKALLHPNKLFREPFGLAPVEAQACGCPVLAFDNGAMRETTAGTWLVKSEEEFTARLKGLAQDGVSDEIRMGCRLMAQRFSTQAMAERYEQLCLEAIQSGGW